MRPFEVCDEMLSGPRDRKVPEYRPAPQVSEEVVMPVRRAQRQPGTQARYDSCSVDKFCDESLKEDQQSKEYYTSGEHLREEQTNLKGGGHKLSHSGTMFRAVAAEKDVDQVGASEEGTRFLATRQGTDGVVEIVQHAELCGSIRGKPTFRIAARVRGRHH